MPPGFNSKNRYDTKLGTAPEHLGCFLIFRRAIPTPLLHPYPEIRVSLYNTVPFQHLQAACSPGCGPDSGLRTWEGFHARKLGIFLLDRLGSCRRRPFYDNCCCCATWEMMIPGRESRPQQEQAICAFRALPRLDGMAGPIVRLCNRLNRNRPPARCEI